MGKGLGMVRRVDLAEEEERKREKGMWGGEVKQERKRDQVKDHYYVS